MVTPFAFSTPFDEQLAFFRSKLNLPSEAWDDLIGAAHDRAFMVAGAAQADLLYDLRGAVDKSVAGGTLDQFRRDFKKIVAQHGWSGWTGEGTPGGIAWRTRVIYQTNIATSYAAGRWKQLTDPDLLKHRPYWRYRHAPGVLDPRPVHLSWDGMVLPHDHPFWKTNYPPNGFGCHCYVEAVDQAAYEAAVKSGKGAPPAGWDQRSELDGTLPGVGQGWDYAPGAGTDTALRQLVQDKLISYPPAISRALSHELNRYINAEHPPAKFARSVLEGRSQSGPCWMGFVENPEAVQAATGLDTKGWLVLLPADVPLHVQNSHGQDGGGQRAPTDEDYNRVADVLARADTLEAGHLTGKNLAPSVVAWKQFGDELWRTVWEVRPGKKNRALALLSFVIKLVGKTSGS